ncbi:MAG TPA: ROK family protein [Verrucomicrobiae bacterium]|nr:ROK family protein [Verrucomicrobiae bacterium]
MGMRFSAPLDPGFLPAVLFNREYAARAKASGQAEQLVIGIEREGGLVSRHEARVLPGGSPETLRYVERLVKTLIWARGGWRIHIGGPAEIGTHIRAAYAPGGARAFDADLMSKVYERPVEVVACATGDVPAAREMAQDVGGHLDGCRIGFDLGASDYKVAAVREGEVVFSEEFPWNPRAEADPAYHYGHINKGLKAAAAHLPRVDAIGGSSAGVIVGNKIMVASLVRSVPPEKFEMAKTMFLRLREEWGVPLVVANDGDVTALAGAMSLEEDGVLGVAMGSSEAAGFIDRQGHILGWLNELAFAPVDFNPEAPSEEWSGDRGVGALYFSQQAVNKLLPAAGIELPATVGLPERLKEVQALMAKGDPSATKIYETIGVYLGYTVAHYADFYDFQHMLILGRVTTGEGGNIILGRAREVLEGEFPDLVARVALHLPDEKSRRVGQAVAAASLPEIGR